MNAKTANAIEMKEAVARAKAFILDLFADENVDNIELEEVDFASRVGHWLVVLSFQKAVDPNLTGALAIALQRVTREKKTVRINQSGDVISVTNSKPFT